MWEFINTFGVWIVEHVPLCKILFNALPAGLDNFFGDPTYVGVETILLGVILVPLIVVKIIKACINKAPKKASTVRTREVTYEKLASSLNPQNQEQNEDEDNDSKVQQLIAIVGKLEYQTHKKDYEDILKELQKYLDPDNKDILQDYYAQHEVSQIFNLVDDNEEYKSTQNATVYSCAMLCKKLYPDSQKECRNKVVEKVNEYISDRIKYFEIGGYAGEGLARGRKIIAQYKENEDFKFDQDKLEYTAKHVKEHIKNCNGLTEYLKINAVRVLTEAEIMDNIAKLEDIKARCQSCSEVLEKIVEKGRSRITEEERIAKAKQVAWHDLDYSSENDYYSSDTSSSSSRYYDDYEDNSHNNSRNDDDSGPTLYHNWYADRGEVIEDSYGNTADYNGTPYGG